MFLLVGQSKFKDKIIIVKKLMVWKKLPLMSEILKNYYLLFTF
jgi:hypothetical protein